MTDLGPDEYARRLDAARAALERLGFDALALSAGSDLTYLCGYEAMPLERLTLLVVGRWYEPVLLVPELEAPRVTPMPGVFRIETWGDGEDMLARAASVVRTASSPRPSVAVGDRMWAQVVLGLQKRIAHGRFSPAAELMRSLREVKSELEIDRLRAAGHAIDAVVAGYGDLDWIGRRERDVAAEIGERILASHQTINFVIVASGPNGASPHHDAGDRVLGAGDTIVVDVGGTKDGYCSDITRVVTLGEPDAEVARAYAALRRAQEAAVAAVAPGMTAEAIDAVARDLLTADGWGEFFVHRTGHGIGMDEHEDPYIVAGNTTVLEPGMCFSIEPGIYLPGRFGLRLEDIVRVTDDGVESFNLASHDLVVPV